MRVLIVGGAGYIGSHTARHLASRGHEVVVLDDLSTGHAEAVAGFPLVRLDLVTGDLEALLASQRFDAVIHFAARCLVPESAVKPSLYWHTNVLGTLRLLDALVACGPKRLVFSSTCAVYGVPTRLPLDETHAKAPLVAYGKSKLAVEHALEDYANAYGLGPIALRYFNAAGAQEDAAHGEDHAQETHLIPLVMRAVLGGEPLRVTGTDYPTPDGTCIRDYIHIDDLARAHALGIEAAEPGRFVAYNLGTGQGHSVREILRVTERITGRAVPSIEAPRRAGDPPELVAAPARVKAALGFEAKKTIEDIIDSAWRWHERHPRGYQG